MEKSIDHIILYLFYVYIFMLPLENILEVEWNIETPFRPYRILALCIGTLILFSRRFESIKFHMNDLKLVGVYVFGLIPTIIAWTTDRFYAESFWSTSLQYFIVLWILLLIKNLPLELHHIFRCMDIYCFSVIINSLLMIYNFFFIDIGRQSGWMDNPHYAAFANTIAFTYFFFLFYQREGILKNKKAMLLIASLICLLGLLVAGSRTSLISLGLVLVIILCYRFSLRKLFNNLILLCIPFLLLFQFIDFNRFVSVVPAWNRFVTLFGMEDSRTILWKQGLEAYRESNYIGLGIEQFKNPENYRKYVHKTDKKSVAIQQGLVLHNDYLAVLFEYGILSFILFISFYLGLLTRLRDKVRQNSDYFVFLLWFIIMGILSVFTSSFQSHSMWFVYIILGFVAYLKPVNNNGENKMLLN